MLMSSLSSRYISSTDDPTVIFSLQFLSTGGGAVTVLNVERLLRVAGRFDFPFVLEQCREFLSHSNGLSVCQHYDVIHRHARCLADCEKVRKPPSRNYLVLIFSE